MLQRKMSISAVYTLKAQKIRTICDSETFYTWKMQVYLGKNGNATREVNPGCRVVLDLVTETENSGRNITCYNFFTSLSLACELPEKETYNR